MMTSISEKASNQQIEKHIQKNISLATYNTFRFDYRAEFFAIAESVESLKAMLVWAQHNKHAVTMIGGGSNLLITGYVPGLVIINRLSGINIAESQGNQIYLTAAAGENWHQLVSYTVQQGLFGIENLALIPGTVGAAPVQNIGAYGVEAKDVISRVQVIDCENREVRWLEAKDCGFAYRDSHFKGKWKERFIIVAVEFELKKQAELLLSYGGLANQIHGEPSLVGVFETVCAVRSEKLPSPENLANAGSFFKNPIIDESEHAQLKTRFPDLVSFPFEGRYKLAAGWLIDQAGWKGKNHQGVGVYEKQALVLVNHSETSAKPLLELEEQIKKTVFDRYGVLLEREPVELPTISSEAS